MCSTHWCPAFILFLIISMVWPLTSVFAARLRAGSMEVDGSVIGLLWRLRVRALHEGASRDELSVELRLLHVITLRKEFPAVATSWRRFVPAWRLVQEWEVGFREAGDGAESEARVTWAEVKEWFQTWKRWQPVVRSLGRGASFVRRRLRVKSLHGRLHFGLGDAALTARAYGVAWALVGNALGFASRKLILATKPDVSIVPIYNKRFIRLEVSGEAAVPQVIAAAGLLVSVFAYARGKRRKAAGKAPSVAGGAESVG